MIKLSKFYKNKKILITGVTGFKGAWLACWLHKMGAKLYGVGHNPNKNKDLFISQVEKNKIKIFDIRDYGKLKNLIKDFKPSIVFSFSRTTFDLSVLC